MAYVAGAMAFIMQIFLMCYHGQCIVSECERLPIRLYESNWVRMIFEKHDNDYKQILHIFMGRLKQNGQILVRVTVTDVLWAFFFYDFLVTLDRKTVPTQSEHVQRGMLCDKIMAFSKYLMNFEDVSDYVGRLPFAGTSALKKHIGARKFSSSESNSLWRRFLLLFGWQTCCCCCFSWTDNIRNWPWRQCCCFDYCDCGDGRCSWVDRWRCLWT